MADMMKTMGGASAKRGMMGKLGQMMGLGGHADADARADRGAAEAARAARRPASRRDRRGFPTAPPPGAFNLPPQFPGLGGPKLPGLGGGFNPFGGKKK